MGTKFTTLILAYLSFQTCLFFHQESALYDVTDRYVIEEIVLSGIRICQVFFKRALYTHFSGLPSAFCDEGHYFWPLKLKALMLWSFHEANISYDGLNYQTQDCLNNLVEKNSSLHSQRLDYGNIGHFDIFDPLQAFVGHDSNKGWERRPMCCLCYWVNDLYWPVW